MYSIGGYGLMMADDVRVRAYEAALRRAITPSATVLDIGTGIGLTAILACRCGARRVFAVEPDDAITLAREIARANGYADRIDFIQGLSTDVTLPERVDVVVSDLRGVLPLFGAHIPAIVDARTRHLADGGRLIPARDTLFAAVVSAPDLYDEYSVPWDDTRWALDLSTARRMARSQWRKARVGPEALVTDVERWIVLDYRTLTDPNVRATLRWTATRSAVAHGVIVWFDTELDESARFSNSPAAPELIYGSAFFPFAEPVPLNVGDRIALDLLARLTGDDYVWAWNTDVHAGEPQGELKTRFRQSSLGAKPRNLAAIRKGAATNVPAVGPDGAVDGFILAHMDGTNPVERLADMLRTRFPGSFARPEDALARVRALSRKYAR